MIAVLAARFSAGRSVVISPHGQHRVGSQFRTASISWTTRRELLYHAAQAGATGWRASMIR